MSDPPSENGSSASDNEILNHQHRETVELKETSHGDIVQNVDSLEGACTRELIAEATATVLCETQSTVESTTLHIPESMPSIDARTEESAITEPSDSPSEPSSSEDKDAEQLRDSWISNRRSASFRYTEEYEPDAAVFASSSQPEAEEPAPPRKMKRAHSFVRLSMADDGTARVITDADKTPSPPHTKSNQSTFSRAAAGLRRSYSAAGLHERLAATRGEPSPKIRRTDSITGRSRDSSTWEFYCDPETRNNTPLITRALQEETGSAADAISLLRASRRRVLGQNQTRQNTPVLARGESTKALGSSGVKKPRASIQRASTTYGRLQTKASKTSDGSESDELPQTESDKENWEPDLPKPSRSRQPRASLGAKRPRQVLRENTEIMSQSNSLGAMLAREHRKNSGMMNTENSDPELDDELREFMGGDVTAAEEAGCVEGLLKLSQGNWR